MGGLLGFRMKTILANFHIVGIFLCLTEKLNMPLRALMACVPKCYRLVGVNLRCHLRPWRKFFFCFTDCLTNHLCCELWCRVCVLRNGMQAFEYTSFRGIMLLSEGLISI